MLSDADKLISIVSGQSLREDAGCVGEEEMKHLDVHAGHLDACG